MIVFLAALLGGFLSRLCGRKSVIPFGLEQWLYALPYLLIFTGSLYGIPAYLAAVLGKRTGHGQYIHLGYLPRQDYSLDEKLDFLLKPFFGEDSGGNYWRSVAGLALTGVAVTLLPGLVYGFLINGLSGCIIVLSGTLKGLAYMIGWDMHKKGYAEEPTKIGEILTGAFAYGTLALIY